MKLPLASLLFRNSPKHVTPSAPVAPAIRLASTLGLVVVATICVHAVGTSPAGAAKIPQTTAVKLTTNSPSKLDSAATVSSRVSAAVPVTLPPTNDLKADIEGKIASVQRQAAPGLTVGAVSCPASLAGKKTKVPVGNYSCSVIINGVPAPYTVIVKEGGSLKGGVFQITPAKAIIDVSKIVAFVKTSLDPTDAANTKVLCGKASVIVADPGAPIACTLTRGKAIETLNFEIRNVNGLVALKTETATPSTSKAAVPAPSSTTVSKATTSKATISTVAPKA